MVTNFKEHFQWGLISAPLYVYYLRDAVIRNGAWIPEISLGVFLKAMGWYVAGSIQPDLDLALDVRDAPDCKKLWTVLVSTLTYLELLQTEYVPSEFIPKSMLYPLCLILTWLTPTVLGALQSPMNYLYVAAIRPLGLTLEQDEVHHRNSIFHSRLFWGTLFYRVYAQTSSGTSRFPLVETILEGLGAYGLDVALIYSVMRLAWYIRVVSQDPVTLLMGLPLYHLVPRLDPERAYLVCSLSAGVLAHLILDYFGSMLECAFKIDSLQKNWYENILPGMETTLFWTRFGWDA